MNLNENAAGICRQMIENADRLRVGVHHYPNGCRVIDCGINVPGGLEAGRLLAEVSMAGLGDVGYFASSREAWNMPGVSVRTDHPAAACMASQHAGWRIAVEGYFASGSGPMRAAAGTETLFETIGHWDSGEVAVGVLEAPQIPPSEVCDYIARQCNVRPESLILLVAPTASPAGTVGIVARSIEMAVHKLFELGFDLGRVESGFGVAPVPPVAAGDLAAVGRTNDALLYGSEVTLWVRGQGTSLATIGPKLPSSASKYHGVPFAGIFQRYGHDFCSIDPALFGPAVVTLFNLDSGRSLRFGQMMPDVLQESFTS